MRKDILVDNNNEIIITDGDFSIGQSDQQHVQHIVDAFEGEYKASPLIGFGVEKYLKQDEIIESEFRRNLKIHLDNDGYIDPEIDLSEGFEKLKIKI